MNKSYFSISIVLMLSTVVAITSAYAKDMSSEEKNDFNKLISSLPKTVPSVVLWDKFQTPIRQQGNRNLCSIFALTAAVEARYKRDQNLNLDLSEQYFWHMYKSTGIKYPTKLNYENQSSIWGGGTAHAVSLAHPYDIPEEKYAPYKNTTQMKAIKSSIPGLSNFSADPTQDKIDAFEYSPNYIPNDAIQNAIYGVEKYTLLDKATVRSPARMEKILASGNEVVTQMTLNWKKNPTTKVYEYKKLNGSRSHVFLIVGYDQKNQIYYVKNSWGESGFIKMSYDTLNKNGLMGSIVNKVTNPKYPRLNGRLVGKWKMDHDGWKGDLIIRRAPSPDQPATRLGHYINSKGERNTVDGKVIDQGRGIEFTLSKDENNAPGTMSGQMFFIDIYSGDVRYASGSTIWNNNPFGIFATRTDEKAPASGSFNVDEWRGECQMNHDGWAGTLFIDGLKAVYSDNTKTKIKGWQINASYTTRNGDYKTVTGEISASTPHALDLKIQFSSSNNQSFNLHYHTRDNDLFSGYTYWAGMRFGVHGFKR